jgi:hypothetical protein
MKKITMELVKDFDGTYYLNLSINDTFVNGIPEYTRYCDIKQYVKEKYQLILPPLSAFKFTKQGRKHYAQIIGSC